MRKSGHSKGGNSNVPPNVGTRENQGLTAEVLQNLNQFLITQTQLMQQVMQQLNGNNASSATPSAAPEELFKDKPPGVPPNEDVSHVLPEGCHPWRYVHCYMCGGQGHFAFGCPQKGKPEQEILCASCNRSGHYFIRCPRRKETQYQVCYNCGREGHFVKQCPLQANLAPQAASVLGDRPEKLVTPSQAAVNCSSSEGKEFLKTSLTLAAQHQSLGNQAAPIFPAEKGRTNLRTPHLQASCRQQDSGHKRKMTGLVQNTASSSKTQTRLPQLNQVPAVTTLVPPASALLPPKQMVFSGDPPLQNKTSKTKVQCFRCSAMGHYASRCPRRRRTIISDNLPEVALIATITPAAGRKANARIMSQVQEYRSLGLPMPQGEIVKQQTSSSNFKLSAQGQPQKKFPPIASVRCFYCKELGHYANNCPKKQQAGKLSSKQQLQLPFCCPPLLSSLCESRGRDSLKGGRFVTP